MAQSYMGNALSSDAKTQITALRLVQNHEQDLVPREDVLDHLLVVEGVLQLHVEGLHQELHHAAEASREVRKEEDHDHDHGLHDNIT